jgi:hypothetical protein
MELPIHSPISRNGLIFQVLHQLAEMSMSILHRMTSEISANLGSNMRTNYDSITQNSSLRDQQLTITYESQSFMIRLATNNRHYHY